MSRRNSTSILRLDHTLRHVSDKQARRRKLLRLEPLEMRAMLAADVRTFDGTGNNLANLEWGSTGEDLLRIAPADYSDGIKAPAGIDRPNPRDISNLIVKQDEETPLNERDLSAFIYAWGQFIDHDLDLTKTGTEAFPVLIPKGDPEFDPNETGSQTIPLNRSQFDPATGTNENNPRQQINSITAYLDGSMIYGSDKSRADALRTFKGGKLKTSEGNLLPLNTLGVANDNPLHSPAESLFVAGDVRANENVELTALHTLFMREHNRLARQYAAKHPEWTDEQVYQQARKIVIAELQVITYNEFLPALLGPRALPVYGGYNPNVNPGIANEFSTAGFRVGHSMVGDDIEFFDNDGEETHEETPMRENFFAPQVLRETGIDPILKYLASDRSQEIDNHIVEDLRSFLFGQPGQGGLDLSALNIQRGREHGLADYNATRVAYGLPAVEDFSDITSNAETQQALKEAYGDVNNIDLWVGGLAEDHVRGGSVGPLISRIVADQFQRLRDGDRFWYQGDLSFRDLLQVQSTTLAKVISANTTISNLQQNVFFFHASITGRVFFDINGDSRMNRGETVLPGVTVQLLDEDGNVLGSTITGRDGKYMFDKMDLGTYTVQVSVPRSLRQAISNPVTMQLTRGQQITANLGIKWRSLARV